jgi:hypothetical protein
MWLRTWLDDGRYIGPVLWQLDTTAIHMNAFPKRAFDSPEERQRVSALIDKYNGQPQRRKVKDRSSCSAASPQRVKCEQSECSS